MADKNTTESRKVRVRPLKELCAKKVVKTYGGIDTRWLQYVSGKLHWDYIQSVPECEEKVSDDVPPREKEKFDRLDHNCRKKDNCGREVTKFTYLGGKNLIGFRSDGDDDDDAADGSGSGGECGEDETDEVNSSEEEDCDKPGCICREADKRDGNSRDSDADDECEDDDVSDDATSSEEVFDEYRYLCIELDIRNNGVVDVSHCWISYPLHSDTDDNNYESDDSTSCEELFDKRRFLSLELRMRNNEVVDVSNFWINSLSDFDTDDDDNDECADEDDESDEVTSSEEVFDERRFLCTELDMCNNEVVNASHYWTNDPLDSDTDDDECDESEDAASSEEDEFNERPFICGIELTYVPLILSIVALLFIVYSKSRKVRVRPLKELCAKKVVKTYGGIDTRWLQYVSGKLHWDYIQSVPECEEKVSDDVPPREKEKFDRLDHNCRKKDNCGREVTKFTYLGGKNLIGFRSDGDDDDDAADGSGSGGECGEDETDEVNSSEEEDCDKPGCICREADKRDGNSRDSDADDECEDDDVSDDATSSEEVFDEYRYLCIELDIRNNKVVNASSYWINDSLDSDTDDDDDESDEEISSEEDEFDGPCFGCSIDMDSIPVHFIYVPMLLSMLGLLLLI
ncbi:unnamed protein product [Rodentolepis nana]|uniref:SRCR domain-containing protein n=1 Tax=Rodentolepis nana TaxID=102285 RepID=A0A0R3T346_RODNA|nr:unnamed protein product [Rodentolepis nana]